MADENNNNRTRNQSMKTERESAKSLKSIASALGVSNKQLAENKTTVDMKIDAKDLKSDMATDTSKKIQDLFGEVAKGGRKERTEAVKQSNMLKDISSSLADPEEKEIIEKQIKSLDNLIASDTKIMGELGDSIKSITTPLAGVVAGLGANSPMIGATAMFAASVIKSGLENRKKRKDEFKQLALEKVAEEEENAIIEERERVKAEHERVIAEQQEAIQEKVEKVTEKTKDSSEVMLAAAEIMLEAATGKKKAPEIEKESALKEKEQTKEKMAAEKENIEELGETIVEAMEGTKVEDEKSGFLAKLLGLKTMITGMFAGFASSVASVGALFKGFGGKILKFIKKIPFIGAIIAGFDTYKALDGLPDDATLGERIYTGLMAATNSILDFFLGIPIWVTDKVFGTDIGGFIESEGGFTELIGNSVRGLFSNIGETIDDLMSGVKDWIKGYAKDILPDWAYDMVFDKELEEQSANELEETKKANLAELSKVDLSKSGVWDFINHFDPFSESELEKFERLSEERNKIAALEMQHKQKMRKAQQGQLSNATDKPVVSSNTQVNASNTSVNTVNSSVSAVRSTSRNVKQPVLDMI